MDKKLGREAEVMGRALGFGQGKAGTTPAARKSARMHRDFQVAVRVVVEMQLGANEDAAIYAVAKNQDTSIRAGANHVELSEPTVRRAFKRYGPDAEVHLRRCIADAER